ncbi:MAG: hypothetical protein RL338_1664 [Chloroflexota bacterium]
MQTSLSRRGRRRRHGAARSGGAGAARGAAVLLPLFLFLSLGVLALTTFTGVVAGYGFFSRDLPDPKAVFANLAFSQQTIVTDSSGKVELARFGEQKRDLIPFAAIPPVLIDATTSIEDKTFWTNSGFDPLAFARATLETLTGNERGASTITQQLVRARLLPPSAFAGSKYERKIKEIIQSIRLTQEYPGEDGKKAILEAYMNQNFFGNQSYGIAAAAKSYFGIVDLDELTLAQAAVLAAIPQSPTTYDLVTNAVAVVGPDGKEQLVVPPDTAIGQRRDLVLERMKESRVLTATTLSDEEIEAAKAEPIVIVAQKPTNWRAPHFVWQVRKEVAGILCGADVEACDRLDNGGYQVTTTLAWNMQKSAEKWVKAAVLAPNAPDTTAYLEALKLPDLPWVQGLRGKDVKNGALIAVDYRTGEVLAYVGSASYYATSTDPKFQPKFDVLADGWRQPGSAFKPINYITGIEARTMTAASMLMDVSTDFGGEYVPQNADRLERGPLRVRQALSFSLNIPAVKAAIENGPDNVFRMAQRFGLTFQSPDNIAGSSIALGTLEVHPTELVSAYGALANGGVLVPRTTVTRIVDADGNQVWPTEGAPAPVGQPVVSKQAAYVITDILDGNTDPKQNPYWGKFRILDGKTRRPAALKTGTTNDTKDLAAYGYLAPPEDPTAPALAVGVWMGNSDNTMTEGVFSLDSTAPLWQAFLTEVTEGMPIADFVRPDGIVEATVDAHSGLLPGPFTTATFVENFIEGTVPTRLDDTKVALEVDAATGLLWQEGCVGPKEIRGFLDLSSVESDYPSWREFTDDWIRRAKEGVGTEGGPGEVKGKVSFFYNGSYQPYGEGWGAPFAPEGGCLGLPPCDPTTGICPPPCDPTTGICPPPCDPTTGPCETPLPTLPVVATVPSLSCQTLAQAASTLATAGLSLGTVSPPGSPEAFVVSIQGVPPGSQLPIGSFVDVILADPASVECGSPPPG